MKARSFYFEVGEKLLVEFTITFPPKLPVTAAVGSQLNVQFVTTKYHT